MIHVAITLSFACLLTSITSATVWAWSSAAHEAIYEIAYQELNTQARKRVDAIMTAEDDERFKTFRQGCTWPDQVRRGPNGQRHDHYINVPRDWKAIAEIRRLVRRGGFAVLPVPIVALETVEYPEPNPHEFNHVRAPGADYVNRYRNFFDSVEVFDSTHFPERHQPFVYENRSQWPTAECPHRPSMAGTKHLEYVPVCEVC